MSRFTADTLQTKYGDKLGQPPLSDAKTPRMLRKALLDMNPPLDISDGIRLIRITHIKWRTCRAVRYPSYAMHNMDTHHTVSYNA